MSDAIERMKVDLPFNLADAHGQYEQSHVNLYRQLIDELFDDNVALKYSHRYDIARIAILMHDERSLMGQLERGEMLEVEGDKGQTVTKKNQARGALEKVRVQLERLTDKFKMNPTACDRNSTRAPKSASKVKGKQESGATRLPRRASI